MKPGDGSSCFSLISSCRWLHRAAHAHVADARNAIAAKVLAAFVVVLGLAVASAASAQPAKATTELQGTVESDGIGLSGYNVSLYIAYVDGRPDWKLLGSDATDKAGRFSIKYALSQDRAGDPSLLFIQAEHGRVLLASALGAGLLLPDEAVVNERTTVAVANAFAQFVDDRRIMGNTYGMLNAAPMAANLADPRTGEVGVLLANSPNGSETLTLATFNSLGNVVASCVVSATSCNGLFRAATPLGGKAPTNVLQALANIVRNPSFTGAQDPIFQLSGLRPIYLPALTDAPTNWLLFLKITGGFYSKQDTSNLMNGPGNFAIDEFGNVWLNENYEPQPIDHFACAGHRLMKFYPWGVSAPWSPYFGGGLSGAGWGITIDPKGDIWVGNFGFQDPECLSLPLAAKNNSVSKFRPDGTAISGADGITQGNLSWPMGTVSDPQGNIWIASCGNDSVTKYPVGDPTRAINIPLGAVPPVGNPAIKPFAIAIDAKGNVWVTNNRGSSVSVLSPAGTLIETIPSTYLNKTVFSHPIGSAFDSKGNLWVANSDWLDAPCPTKDSLGMGTNSSVTMLQAADRKPSLGSPYKGGGIAVPWGIAVDGDDTVWAFNFGAAPPPGPPIGTLTSIVRLCGVDTKKCPAGLRTGDPISPQSGYQSDALTRITSGQIDPSGNIWITGNWKITVDPEFNPGQNSIVVVVGAAGPLKTPLRGLPSGFK